jgi:mannosyltransferase
VPAVLEHGRTGFLYEPGDVATLRELLTMLLREPERGFGVEHEARALAEVYQAALER